jgi:hypothetical protein
MIVEMLVDAVERRNGDRSSDAPLSPNSDGRNNLAA